MVDGCSSDLANLPDDEAFVMLSSLSLTRFVAIFLSSYMISVMAESVTSFLKLPPAVTQDPLSVRDSLE